MSSSAALRAKGRRFIADARATQDPARRAALLRCARLTLAEARRHDAARYLLAVGRDNATPEGYRAWRAAHAA